MPTPLHWSDRLRLERVIWTLDTYLQSLPARARRAVRREMRANLRASAAEVGVSRGCAWTRQRAPARDRLPRGGVRRWAASQPAESVRLDTGGRADSRDVVFVGAFRVQDGVEAANQRPNGTYAWGGWDLLGVRGEVTYADGQFEGFDLWFMPWVLLYPLVFFLVSARSWRVVSLWWRRRRPAPARRSDDHGAGTTAERARRELSPSAAWSGR